MEYGLSGGCKAAESFPKEVAVMLCAEQERRESCGESCSTLQNMPSKVAIISSHH